MLRILLSILKAMGHYEGVFRKRVVLSDLHFRAITLGQE